MEYHKDRFEDFSLMVFEKETLVAVLPANSVEDRVYSHQGLTYGGVVFSFKTKLFDAIDIVNCLLDFFVSKNIIDIYIKMLPNFYQKIPSDELDFFMFKAEASLIKKDVAMVIDYSNRLKFRKNRREGINKALRHNIEIREDNNFKSFWEKILIPNLKRKHDVEPVHKLSEIEKLASNFPENIKQINAYNQKNEIIAGTTVFLTDTVVHPQYVSGGDLKNVTGAMDLLYDYVIKKFKGNRKYFDFNTSSENNGQILNKGLIFWKESCGARAFTINTYRIQSKSKVELELK